MKTIYLFFILNITLIIVNCFPQQPGWDTLSIGVWGELNSVHFIDKYDLYMCGDLILNFKSTDNGITWQLNNFSSPVTLNDIFVIDQYTVVAVGDGGTTNRTTDGGNTWNMFNSGVTDDLLSVSFVDSFGICGALSQTILYSTNAGASWNIAQSGYFGGGFWGAHLLSPQIGFVAGENSIFQPLFGMTTDSGANWNFTAFYLNNNEGRATGVDFTDMFIGYVSARVWDGRGAIAKTSDSGSSWLTTFFNNPLWDVDFPISATGLVGFAVGDQGVILKTYDAGVNWQQQQSGNSFRLNGVHFVDFDYGLVVGENGIILRTETGGEPVTKVAELTLNINEFRLEQNYPNPFNPSTKIKFTSPSVIASGLPARETGVKQSHLVTLKVFDVLGNEIATLVNEELIAGDYEVEFNVVSHSIKSANSRGNLSSGIYIYQLRVDNQMLTKKMVLVR